jgi:hypothetical protein
LVAEELERILQDQREGDLVYEMMRIYEYSMRILCGKGTLQWMKSC